MVVSINSTPVSHLKLSAVTAMLDELEASKRRDEAQRSMSAAGSGRAGSGSGSGSGGRRSGKKMHVLLREVEVHAWPPNWRNEVRSPVSWRGVGRIWPGPQGRACVRLAS